MGRKTEPHDLIVKLIIVERIVKGVLLLILAVSLIVAGETGALSKLADEAEYQLNLRAGGTVFVQLATRVLDLVGSYNHIVALSVGLIAYACLEGGEGVGLALRRRWAEYLTVIATGLLIPYEVYEVIHKPTLFKVGALVLNVAVVVYLAYRKRLFVGV